MPIVIAISYFFALGVIGAMTGAPKAAIGLIGVDRVVRKQYPAELGPLSESYGRGLIINAEGDQIGASLWELGEQFEGLREFRGKTFHLKVVEAKEVFTLIEGLKASQTNNPVAAIPLTHWLQKVAKYRISTH